MIGIFTWTDRTNECMAIAKRAEVTIHCPFRVHHPNKSGGSLLHGFAIDDKGQWLLVRQDRVEWEQIQLVKGVQALDKESLGPYIDAHYKMWTWE